MTVRRNEQKVFDADGARLVGAVGGVLRGDSVYRDVEERDGVFTATFRPNFLFMGTGMRVSFRDGREEGAVVDVTVVSQSLTQADPFGHYDRIIRDFFSDVERRVEDPDAPAPDRGPTETWYGRWTLATVGIVVALFAVLPAVLALLGFGGFALYFALFPFGAALGFVLAHLVARLRRRSGLVVAVPVAVVGFVAAFALLVTMDIMISEFLLPESSFGSFSGAGLGTGVVLRAFLRMKPEGFEGETSDLRGLRGARGVLVGTGRGARHWLLGKPHFRGNLPLLVFGVLTGLPVVSLGIFSLATGDAGFVASAFLLLGVGVVLFWLTETVSLGPRWATVAGRVVGLLSFPGFLVAVLVVA